MYHSIILGIPNRWWWSNEFSNSTYCGFKDVPPDKIQPPVCHWTHHVEVSILGFKAEFIWSMGAKMIENQEVLLLYWKQWPSWHCELHGCVDQVLQVCCLSHFFGLKQHRADELLNMNILLAINGPLHDIWALDFKHLPYGAKERRDWRFSMFSMDF